MGPVFRLLPSPVRPVFRLPSSPVRSRPLPSGSVSRLPSSVRSSVFRPVFRLPSGLPSSVRPSVFPCLPSSCLAVVSLSSSAGCATYHSVLLPLAPSHYSWSVNLYSSSHICLHNLKIATTPGSARAGPSLVCRLRLPVRPVSRLPSPVSRLPSSVFRLPSRLPSSVRSRPLPSAPVRVRLPSSPVFRLPSTRVLNTSLGYA